MANFLSLSQQYELVRFLGLGTPIRHLEYGMGVAQETVRRYARLLGAMAIDFLDEFQRDLEVSTVEMDEFYTFVAAKKDNVRRMKKPVPNAGQQLHFLSVVPKTGFVVNYLVAPTNDIYFTQEFVKDFAARLKRKPDGSFSVKPTLISDGHGSYGKAIDSDSGPGASVNYLRLNKKHTDKTADGKKTRRRFDGVFREVVLGETTDPEFWTNNVESLNRTARSQNRRVSRRTPCFSKRYDPHVQQFAYWIFHHNYVFVPDRRKVTPAMEVGATDKLFEPDDVIKLLNRYVAKSKERGLINESDGLPTLGTVEQITQLPIDAPYWLYHNFDQNTVRIHRATCCNCRNGMGRGGETGRSGMWYPAHTLESATERASQLEPDRHAICNMCLGQRRSLGRRL